MTKKKKVRWGVKWGEVGTGGAMLLGGGCTAIMLYLSTGRIYVWPAAIGFIGIFILISGLMGEDGVW